MPTADRRHGGGHDPVPVRTGRLGLSLSATSVALVGATAVLGHSVAVPVHSGAGLPPYAATANPSAALVTGLLVAAVAFGAVGLLLAWLALRRGWRPPARRLVVAGCLVAGAFVLLPHIGSADPESYAAYGREAAVGIDPYAADPSTLTARGDAYGAIVERPWQHTPSVYGPVATAEAQAAVRIAGDNPRTAVWLLDLVGALAFIATALLLFRLADDDDGRARAAVFWAANPLLLWQLVAGGHVDTLEIALAVGSVALIRRAPLLAGVLVGGAIAVKLPAALVAAGLAWTLRRTPRRVVAFGAGALAVLVAGYATAGSHAFDQARVASRYVSRATPWRPLATALDHAWGRPTSREFIGSVAVLIGIGVVAALVRSLPDRAPTTAAHPALVLVLAYVLVTPYALPWYDGLAWALIVAVPASRFDLVLLAHTSVLSLAYIPGRDVALPPGIDDLTGALRDVLAPPCWVCCSSLPSLWP